MKLSLYADTLIIYVIGLCHDFTIILSSDMTKTKIKIKVKFILFCNSDVLQFVKLLL